MDFQRVFVYLDAVRNSESSKFMDEVSVSAVVT